MSIGYRLPDSGEVGWLESSTKRFELPDAVGFQLGLRVQPLHGRCTKCGSGNGGVPLCGLKQIVRPLAEARAIYDLQMLVMRDRKKRPVLESVLADGTNGRPFARTKNSAHSVSRAA
jgi:hypothetical protein